MVGEGRQIWPRIPVTTYHTFEIHYKFRWRCATCGHEEGRHSKSIDETVDTCVVCRNTLFRVQ
jgi:hypothetical protein